MPLNHYLIKLIDIKKSPFNITAIMKPYEINRNIKNVSMLGRQLL